MRGAGTSGLNGTGSLMSGRGFTFTRMGKTSPEKNAGAVKMRSGSSKTGEVTLLGAMTAEGNLECDGNLSIQFTKKHRWRSGSKMGGSVQIIWYILYIVLQLGLMDLDLFG
jgi:hypothetical protein